MTDSLSFEGFDSATPTQPLQPSESAPLSFEGFDSATPTSAVLSEAARVNPDQQVKINQLSRDTGIPVDDVAVDPLGVEADHRAKKVASEDFTAHPSTGKFLSDFDKAAIAHDDVGVLKKLETSLKVGAGVFVDAHLAAADKGAKAAKWFTQSFEGSGANFIRRMELAGRGLMQASSEGDGADYSKLLPEQIAMAKALGVEDTSSPEFIARTDKVNERIATLQKEISENTPRNLDLGQKMLRGGVESTMVSAPGLIASLATRSATPAIVSAGTFTFGDSYAEGRRSGLSHDDAVLYGSVDSIIEMGTEYAPTKILGSVLDGGELKKKILKYAVTEVLGEQAATAGQTTNAVLNGIDEEWNNATTLEEKIKLQAERQLITLGSTVVAGSIQAGGVGGLRRTIDHFAKKRDEEISQFQVDQTSIDSIAVDANNSELRRRDADSFHQFMSQADGDNNTHVFIDGVQAKLYLDTLEDKESPAVKLLAAGINDAAALGSDVVIPIADFATHIAGTEHFTALREFMNLNGTAPSPFRLKQSQEETETLMTDLMTRANENVSQYVESQQIFDTVKQQLIDTGRINSKNADVMARIVPAWATVFARDNGINIQQAYEQSGLVIQGPQTGEAARMGAELETLGQSFSTAMDSVKSLGEVVKEGKPDSVLGESVVLKFDNAQVQASIREDENNVYLTSIAAKKLDDLAEVATGTGRGTSVIDQLKKYADQTGKRLAVVDSTKSAKSYYEKISYLKQDDVTLDFDGEAYTPPISFTYTPTTLRQQVLPDTIRKGTVQRTTKNSTGEYLGANEQVVNDFWNYFGDSKIVDEKGAPKVVYSGTPGDLTTGDFTFDYSKIGSNGRVEGAGFYFTNNKDIASSYGNVISAYLAMQKPMPYDQPAFNKATIKKLLSNIAKREAEINDADIGDGFLSNFGDVNYEGLQKVINSATELVMNDDKAIDQLGGLVGAGVDVEIVNRAVQEVTGFDGIVAKGFENRGDENSMIYVAFFPEQVKSVNNKGSFDTTTGNIFNQFVGVNAQGVPMAELDRAKHMREQGLGNNAIQRDTGWFMGVDGKWRYEISDHEAEWSIKPSQIPTHMETSRAVSRELFDVKFEELNDYTRAEVLAVVRERRKQYTTVGGMLNHSALFKAYPSLRNIKLIFTKLPTNENGSFDSKTNTIELNEANSESEQLSTLMHELQHAIQELEDFARGGSDSKPFADSVKAVLQRLDADMTNKLDTWDYRNQWKFKTVDKAVELSRNALMYQSYKRLLDYAKRDKPSGVFRHILNESQWIYDDKFRGSRDAQELQLKFYEIPRSGPKRQEAVRDIAYTIGFFLKSQIPESQITMFENDNRTMTGMINALSREASKAKELLKPRQELLGKAKRAALVAGVTKFKTPYDIYRALGGEIEARITQARLKLTPEQRRVRSIATDADVPMSEAIVVMGGMELAVPEALSKSAPEKFDQSVYHGSPHQFDKFSLSAMGTGEGAQAYGWGMYFAGKKSVAEYYRDTLSGGGYRLLDANNEAVTLNTESEQNADAFLKANGFSYSAALSDVKENAPKEDWSEGAISALKLWEKSGYTYGIVKTNKGNLYQVNIPDDNELLDYDRPLSAQSSSVKEKLSPIIEYLTTRPLTDNALSNINSMSITGSELIKYLTGEMAIEHSVDLNKAKRLASEALHQEGILGLKFMDGDSRNKPINEIKKEFMDELPEDAEISDVESLIGTGVFSDKNEAIIKGLINDDWLGFDYPAQAISAALGKNATNYDMSKELKTAIEKAQEGGTSNYVIWDENVVTIESVNDEQRKAEQFEQQSRGYYEPANSLIRLTEASNLSTFMHEFAHFMYEMELKSNGKKLSGIHNWFKRNAVDVAKEANDVIAKQTPDFTRPALVVTPSDVTLYLDNGTTGDANIDTAIRVATHEQFARGWEAYIMEGKSPSIELRNVFRAMAQWMVEIYKSIRGLNVKLDDEMRKVLDAMVATEEQIKMAEARARFAPLFTDAAAAGMTEAEFAAYKERVEKTQGAATETLRDKLIAQITRAKKQEWKEEKQDLIDTELTALKALPVYKAIDALRNGDFKLDHATVKELYGVEKTDARGITSTRIPPALTNMTAKGATGVHPDEAAAFFGYGSGAEMIDAITKAKPIGEAAAERAEAIMVDRHGDILNDGSIEKEADDAVQNEERGRLILAELKVLSRGQRSIDREVIRGLAEETIGKLSYRQIHPNKYRNAEIKAAMEAASMFAKGNMEGAAAAKARQVMNYFLAMEATAAQNNITKIVDSMNRYNKKEVREEIMKAENGYWEQIVKILERFEFRKSATLSSVEQHNQDINTWAAERMTLDGDGLVLSPVVLNELYKDHWKNVKYNDLQGVSDSVKNIEHVARYSNKMIRMGEEITFKKLVNKLVDHWSALPQRFKAQRTTVVDGKNYGRWIMGQMTKIPYLVSWLDGGERIGLSHQVFVQPFNDAKHAEVALWKQIGDDVMKAIENRSKADKKRHNAKVFIPEIKDANNDGNLMGHQILAVALNTGNAGNLRKMLLGEGWANPENDAEITFGNPKLQAVLKHMTESDWKLVQLIWDRMDQLYPQLAEVHRRTTGLTPPKVEATPVVTPFGTFNGGYYPMKYDPNRSHKAELNEERLNANTESMFSTTGSIQSSVNASATNERTKYYAPVRLSLDVVPNHFQEVIHFITHHDAVREVNKLIRNKSIAESIKTTMGSEEFAQLKPWLNDIAKDGSETKTKTFIEKAFGKLRMGTTLGVMGFKATTGILQVSGIFNTMGEAGAANTIHALRTILAGPDSIKSAWEFARDNSKTLSHRAESFDREMQSVMSALQNKSGKLAMLQSVSMKHIAYIQLYMVDLPSWYAGYLKAMKEHGDEQRAYQYGDWIVEQAQGSGLTKDMAALFRNQGEVHRSLTMFMTYFSSLWNLERDIVKGTKSGKYNALDLAAKGLFFFTLPVLFEMLLRGKFGDDDDEEVIAQKLALQLALFPIQSVPFVRDLANASATDFGYTMSPVASILAKGIEGGSAISSDVWEGEDVSARDIKNVTKLAGAAFGIPGTGQAWNSGEHLYNVIAEGEDLTFRELVIGPVKKQ